MRINGLGANKTKRVRLPGSMTSPLESGEEPINHSADVLNSQDSLSTEQSTSDNRNVSVHHENISPTQPRYSPR